MKQEKLSLCFYPTTICLIDDNKEYLKQMKLRLSLREKFLCRGYDDSQKALDFLTNEYKTDSFIHHCMRKIEDAPIDHFNSSLDIRAIHHEIYNPHRFDEITVLVVDYAMPGVDGLEFCRKLRNTSMKIIMLTGEAGKELAVEAFNEGSIDKFILKSTPDLMKLLVQAIHELQSSYFLNLSGKALNKISNFSNSLTCLDDSVFVSFFHEFRKKHRLIEYYLMDNDGSFLFLDAQGQPSWLVVAGDEMMETYYELAVDDKAPETVIDALKNKRMIPYFYSHDDFNVRPQQWTPYLHPVNVLEGKEHYYYAYIADSALYAVESEKIISFNHFLKAHSQF